MKRLCLILAIIIFPTLGFSQFVGDSVIIYVDNRVEINVAIADYSILKTAEKPVKALKEFSEMLPDMQDQLLPDKPDLVKYSPGSSLTVEPGDPKVIYLLKNGEPNNTGFRDRAIINGEDFTITITTTDLSKIADMPLSGCLEKIKGVLPAKRSWSMNLYYECVDGEIKELKERHKVNPPLDFLELNLGAGAGLIRSTWVSDISLGVGIGFNKKGVYRYPYVSSNMMFNFDSEKKMHINTFLNVGFGWNINTQAKRNELLGLEVGYLISRQGDLFGENTFKLGANWSPLKSVYVSPQLYITDNFKTAYPAIRIGFGF